MNAATPISSSGPTQTLSHHPILVSFSGIDGSGKSTQIEMLRTRLEESGLSVQLLTFWDNVVAFSGMRAGFSRRFLQSEGGVGAPDKPVKRNDKNARTWYLTLGRSVLHLSDAFNLRRVVAKARKSRAEVIIFDRYIYDQLATLPLERGVGRAWARVLLRLVPAPAVALLLDADPEAARARKPEYPIGFMHSYRASYLRLREMTNLVLIEPRSREEVHETIMRHLAQTTGRTFPAGIYRPLASA